ncbi:MAG: hypothetical protein ACLRZH_00890 [Ruthenibacterium lactatiformans]
MWLERASFTKNCTACTLELSTRDCARDALVLAALCPGTRVRRLGGTVLPCTERARRVGGHGAARAEKRRDGAAAGMTLHTQCEASVQNRPAVRICCGRAGFLGRQKSKEVKEESGEKLAVARPCIFAQQSAATRRMPPKI